MTPHPDNPLAAASIWDAEGALPGEVPHAAGEATYTTPLRYRAGALAEYACLREDVALIDLSERGTLAVTGDDRAKWLHGLCTQHIKRLLPLQGAYACHVDIKGRVLADLWAFNAGDQLLIDLEPGVARPLRRALKGFIVMEQVRLQDRSDLFGTLGLAGPRAAALLDAATGQPGHADLDDGCGRMEELAGLECLVIKTSQLGAPGFRVAALREQLPDLWRALRRAGAAPAGFEAAERARLRAGRPRFGADLSPDTLFNEANLTDAVNFNKGCYLGQEVIERVDARGNVGRRLMGLQLAPGAPPPPPGSAIRNAERALGHITSSASLEDLGFAAAMGYIHRAHNAPGLTVQIVEPEGAIHDAIIVERLHMHTPMQSPPTE